VIDYASRFPEGIRALVDYLDSGQIKHKETIFEGFDQLPNALINLFEGGNIGKQLVALDHAG